MNMSGFFSIGAAGKRGYAAACGLNAMRAAALSAIFLSGGASATDLSLKLDPQMTQHTVSASRAASRSASAASATSSSSARGGSAVGVGSQGQSLSVDNHSLYQAQDRNPVSSAVAPALMTSNDTCMGSTSVGASAVSFGLSIGSTWTDNNCLMLKNAREMWNMGFKGAALARLCMDDLNREAMEAAGMSCPERRTKTVENSGGRDEAGEIYRY